MREIEIFLKRVKQERGCKAVTLKKERERAKLEAEREGK